MKIGRGVLRACALALASLSLAACNRNTPTAWRNESRAREDRLKAEFDAGFAHGPRQLLLAVVETAFPRGENAPRSPTAAAPGPLGGALILDNNSGRVFSSLGVALREVPLEQRLTFPSMIRADGSAFYVSDNEGLRTFDHSGKPTHHLRPFLAIHDFVLVESGAIAVNPRMRTDDAPIVALLEPPSGAITARWGRNGAGLIEQAKRSAHLASCGARIIAGLAHEPTIHVFTSDLRPEAVVDVPFPRKDALMALSADDDLTRPAAGVTALPTFIGGVACVDNTLFVLLDLPRLHVLEYDLPNTLRAVHHADMERPNRHFRRLNAAAGPFGSVRLITIAEDPDGTRSVVEALVRPVH